MQLLPELVGTETVEVKYFNRMLMAPMWAVRRRTVERGTKETILRQLTPPRPWVNAAVIAAFRAEHRSGALLDAARVPGTSPWFADVQGLSPSRGCPRVEDDAPISATDTLILVGVSTGPSESSDVLHPRVVEANQRVHSQLASRYNESEPHFRPENQAKVRRRLVELATRTPSTERMLDLGCGTGFLLGLAHDLFTTIDGIDATRAMLDRVDLSPGNITLHQGVVEALPFESNTFDFVTAYSFLDHLADHLPVLDEAHRVLRPNGILYVDLIPNRSFWNGVYSAAESSRRPFDPIVEREINELVNHEQKLEEQFGIDPVDWQNAEPAKSEGKGFDGEELLAEVEAAGFVAEIRYEWYLGQAVVLHGESMEAAEAIDAHLRRLLPVSGRLFKYIVLTATKK